MIPWVIVDVQRQNVVTIWPSFFGTSSTGRHPAEPPGSLPYRRTQHRTPY